MAAKKPTYINATASGFPVKAAGVKWMLGMSGNWSSYPGATHVEVYILHVNKRHHSAERHFWDLGDLPKSILTKRSAKSWTVALKGNQGSPLFDTFRMTYHVQKHTHQMACTSGSDSSSTGTITGEVTLNSGLKRLGTIKTGPITLHHGFGDVNDNCLQQPEQCATANTNWYDGPSAGSTVQSVGTTIGRHDNIQISSSNPLARPAHATRTDQINATGPPLKLTGRTLQIRTGHNTGVTGSGKARKSGPARTSRIPCVRGGTRTQVDTNWSAQFSSMKLKAKTLLSGVLATKRTGTGILSTTRIRH